MKALSLTRPWTWLVLHGGKDVENRVWQTSHRGPLVVHGALSRDPQSVVPFLDLIPAPARAAWSDALTVYLEKGPVDVPAYWTGLLGLVDVVGCCTVEMTGQGVCMCGPWAMPGQAHWHLANPRPFARPIPAKGALGLWSLSPAQAELVDEQMGHARA